jgi:predicted membrane-bound mannosyltransferase
MLFFSHTGGGPVWTEAIILDLAALGLVLMVIRRKMHGGFERDSERFFALYAVVMAVIYSTIPYKTPWSMLGFLHAWIILGALGFDRLWSLAAGRVVRGLLVGLLLLAGTHLAWQASLANYRYYDDPVNPYVYAQAVDDVVTAAAIIKDVAHATPEGEALPVQVICPGNDYWPLPWYLRSFSHVGWWSSLQQDLVPTPIILATPDIEGALLQKLYESPPPGERYLYVPLFASRVDLRPGKEIRGYVRHDVWEQYRRAQAGQVGSRQ